MQHRETVLVATATASAAAAAASSATDHADHVLWLKAKRYDVLLPWFVIVARTTEVRIARNIQGDPVVEWTAVSKARRERRALRRRRARLARAARTAPGEIKISAAIIRMIEPYSPEDLELDRHRVLVTACAAAWNMAVLEQCADRDRPMVWSALEKVRNSGDRIGATALLEELKKRKMLLFPDDRRFIVGSNLELLKSGDRYLTAASTPLDNPVRPAIAPAENTPANGTATEDSDAAAPGRAGQRFPKSR